MTALWIVLALLGVAVWRLAVALRNRRRRARDVEVTLTLDTSEMEAALARVSARAAAVTKQLARGTPRRACGCPVMCDHVRACPDHPANRGLRSRIRWESQRAAARWHWWRARRLTVAADRHERAAYDGRWRR